MSRQLVPPDGGWKFLEGDCWLFGHSFNNLVENLKSHRESNAIPMGDVEKDIEERLMKLNPSIVLKS